MSARENLFEAIVTATTRGQCDEANMIRLVEAYRVEVLISAGVEYEDCTVCGAARGVGNPCNTCAFKALIASKVGKREEATAAAATATPELTIYRAEYDSFVFGLYTTAATAREHCEAHERRDQPTATFDWIEDEEDGVAELVATVDGEENPTGYIVTALEVASEYDAEADE